MAEGQEPVRVHQLQTITEGIVALARDIRNDMHDQEDRRINSSRKREQLNNILKCDGVIPAEVRDWCESVEIALRPIANIDGAPAYLASNSSLGGLHKEIEHFLFLQPNRNQVTWPEIRNHVTVAFISANEDEKLKGELESIKQKVDEGISLFNRRFRMLARKAYPIPRTVDGERIVLRAYVNSLRDAALARKMVVDQRVANAEGAMTYTEEQAAGMELLNTMGIRCEPEPIEIGMTSPRTAEQNRGPSEVDRLQRQNEKLSTRLAKCEVQMSQMKEVIAANREGGRNANGNNAARRGREPLVCWQCGFEGHFRRDCRQRTYTPRRPRPTYAEQVNGGNTSGGAQHLNGQRSGPMQGGTRPH